ncbi:hypothetical protein [Amorphus sp. MBR-141]
MRRFVWLMSAGAVLFGCVPQGSIPTERVALLDLTPSQRASVEAGVRDALKDPESARFGEMYAGRSPSDLVTVCGYVNAKNSFGGYTGEKPFGGSLVDDKLFVVFGIGGTESREIAVISVCRKNGIAI